MSEPAIVSYGRSRISEYSTEELRDALVRAFGDHRAEYILLDSSPRGQGFTSASIAWGIDEGLLYNDVNDDDGQQVVSSFRLTKLGKREILGQP